MTSHTADQFRQEVDRNYEAFLNLGDDFHRQHFGMYALMKDAKVVETFTSWQDARKTAKLLYKDTPFSIQQVANETVDLGFYSHVHSQHTTHPRRYPPRCSRSA